MTIEDYDPDDVGVNNGNYFGMPFDVQQACLLLLSVPWDVTVSYGEGTSQAPDAIIGASTQLDMYDQAYPDAWRAGIATVGIDYSIQERSARLRDDARRVISRLEGGAMMIDEYLLPRKIEKINNGCEELMEQIYQQSKQLLQEDKVVGIVGGDHSTPFGLIRAVGEKYGSLSLLQIDAHADLRQAYEGFVYSHASIMYNVLTRIEQIERLIQVGVRDFCRREYDFACSNPKVGMFYDRTLRNNAFAGMTWQQQCRQIVEALGQHVYVSFDIDGLSPENCPSTGTPVVGGLSFNQAAYLIETIVESGRRIVGFDVCEVSPSLKGEWDANVGARILYKLSCAAISSRSNG